MISNIGIENSIKYNNPIKTDHNQKQNPSFKGWGASAFITCIQACEQNPMLNVTLIDLLSAILPRTFIESLTNIFAGFEAFRRESSGLIVNCLIPSCITLVIAKMLNKSVMPNGADMSSCWADSNLLEHISKTYESSKSSDKVTESFKKILSQIEGYDSTEKVKFSKALTESDLENYAKQLKDLTQKDLNKKELKKQTEKIANEIASKTNVYEKIKLNNSSGEISGYNLDTIFKDTIKFFKEYRKVGSDVDIVKFAKQSKKLVRAKSLLGLTVVLPLAASMQFINRKITEKISGTKGAPIYKDYGKSNETVKDCTKSKEGLLKQKIISIASMLLVGRLSMMKKLSMNMLEFKGIFPTMDQARIISTTTFASRMAAADDKNELAESTKRDIATFLSLYFLGDYAAKATATIIQNKTGIELLNDTKPLEKDANVFKKAWHWFKDVNVKSSKEVTSKTKKQLKGATPTTEQAKQIEKELNTAIKYRSGCQIANFGVSLVLLGLIIPIFIRRKTLKKHAEEIEVAKTKVSSESSDKPTRLIA
ncbi:MAG: hypothetical protein MJ237_04445 [bacterium]|nr:hypothetical protein [bacterium]